MDPRPAPARVAHPHSRGENASSSHRPRPCGGSSPLTRGKPSAPRRACRDRGLIPTHAGKTLAWRRTPRSSTAHPHSRGENVTLLPQQSAQPGSSPLTRGKLDDLLASTGFERLIPTHAGKTTSGACSTGRHGAHPHSRGENYRTLSQTARMKGSSPLTRGKRCRRHRDKHGDGLIPTHAGKTRSDHG